MGALVSEKAAKENLEELKKAFEINPSMFREDRYSGDNWIEFNGKRFVIGDLYELEQAYQALDLEINFLYFGNNDGIHT